MIFWRKTFPQNMIIWHVRIISIGDLTEFEKWIQNMARLNVLVQSLRVLKNWFKSEAFQKFWFRNCSFFQNFFSQNNAFQESMEEPTLTFLRWKLTQKPDFSTAIFRTNSNRLEKKFNSKENVFPEKNLSQNHFFQKSVRKLSL